MNARNTNPIGHKLALFCVFFFSASILLVIPNLLNGIHKTLNNPPTTAAIKPIGQQFWSELNQARQLVQTELSTLSNSITVTSSATLRKNAQLHFRQAMATLPSSARTIPGLREIHAGIENDLELLQLEKNTIRQLAAQQIIIGINRIERLIRAQRD